MSTAPATLLVLGAAAHQLPFIERARARGHRVVTLDNRPDNPGHALAHRAYTDLSTLDVAAVLRVAAAERIAGILTPATDVAVPTAAAVGARLGLRAPPMLAADALVFKTRFRALQSRLGLPQPAWRALSPADGAAALPGPGRWVIKPDLSSGAKGIESLTDAAGPAAWSAAVALARAVSLNGLALAESHLDGANGTCEGFLRAGEPIFSLITDRLRPPDPRYGTTLGHRTPASLDADRQAALLRQIQTLTGAVGYRDGPFDCDFIAVDDQVVILELAARTGGNFLATFIESATGLPWIDWMLDFALGGEPSIPSEYAIRPTLLRMLGSPVPGRIEYDPDGLDAARTMPGVLALALDRAPGSPVEPWRDSTRTFGHCLVQAGSVAALESLAAAAETWIGLRVVPAEPPA